MNKFFLVILLIIHSLETLSYDYIHDTYDLYDCFSKVEFNELSPGRRNNGFNFCQKHHTPRNFEVVCPDFADKYYGLRAKRIAMNKCLSITTTYNTCRNVANNMPSYPMRMTNNLFCLNTYIEIINEKQCYKMAQDYHPIRKRINQICNEAFPKEEINPPVKPVETEIIVY